MEEIIKLGETEFLDKKDVFKEKLIKLKELYDNANYVIFYTG
jgi:hypothetical protein